MENVEMSIRHQNLECILYRKSCMCFLSKGQMRRLSMEMESGCSYSNCPGVAVVAAVVVVVAVVVSPAKVQVAKCAWREHVL